MAIMMRLDHEAVLLYVVAILAYAFLTQVPFLFDVTVFYLLLATAGLFVAITIGEAKLVDVRNDLIIATMALVHLNMFAIALAFGAFRIISKYAIFLPSLSLAFAFFVLVAIGETMIYIVIPTALATRYPRLTIPLYLFFAVIFALLHRNAYGGDNFLLLQPLIAALINQYIFRKFKNLSGVVLGHAITDLIIALR